MPLLTGSPDKTSTISEVKMSEIINKEKTQKVNYAKMKMKQLVFTQVICNKTGRNLLLRKI